VSAAPPDRARERRQGAKLWVASPFAREKGMRIDPCSCRIETSKPLTFILSPLVRERRKIADAGERGGRPSSSRAFECGSLYASRVVEAGPEIARHVMIKQLLICGDRNRKRYSCSCRIQTSEPLTFILSPLVRERRKIADAGERGGRPSSSRAFECGSFTRRDLSKPGQRLRAT